MVTSPLVTSLAAPLPPLLFLLPTVRPSLIHCASPCPFPARLPSIPLHPLLPPPFHHPHQREIACYTVSKLDRPFSEFMLDFELDVKFKVQLSAVQCSQGFCVCIL